MGALAPSRVCLRQEGWRGWNVGGPLLPGRIGAGWIGCKNWGILPSS